MQPNGHPAHSNLYVKGLPLELEQGELQQLFQIFGAIESCRIVRDMSTGVSKGYGFVKFSAVQNAVDAIKGLHGSTLGSSTVEVKLADVDIGPAPSGKLFTCCREGTGALAAEWQKSMSATGPMAVHVFKRPWKWTLHVPRATSTFNRFRKRCIVQCSGLLTRCQDSIGQPVRQELAPQLDRTGAERALAVAASPILGSASQYIDSHF